MTDVVKTWTRWHSDGWVLTVIRTSAGKHLYKAQQEQQPETPMAPAASLVDAQHKAEDVVRNSGHRCVARCSFWIANPLDED
jgi:hypothetical protein